jgi:PAS domain S-box-containing protein
MPPLDTIAPTFADFFRSTPVAMKVLNTQNNILYANLAFQGLLARDEESLRETLERDLIHPVDLYRFRERFKKVVERATEFSEIEARHRHADGHWIPTMLNHMWLSGRDSSEDFILEVVVDLTKQRELEQPASYHQSKQLLGQMARGVAHDFNNLLTIIMMKLALIEARTGNDDALQKTLEETGEVLDRMRRLSDDLAHFGEVQEDDAEQLQVNDAIEAMTKYFDYIRPKSVAIDFELADGLPSLEASSVQLEQVLLNLVVNACDAIVETREPGTVTICTALEQIDEPAEDFHSPAGRYVRVSVKDDGVGMDEQTRERMFEPFFSTKGDGGTGVGLTTVYAIVQQGRGYIEVQSEPGEGTSVDIFLPAAPS